MTRESQKEHQEHEADAEDHFRWSADHMYALSVLRRVEARLYQHESVIQKHRLEVMRHEQGIGGDMSDTHHALQQRHDDSTDSHRRLLKAILDLERVLGD